VCCARERSDMHKSARDVLLLSALSGVGLVSGMVTQSVLAHRFGAGAVLDLYFGTQAFPKLVFGQLAFGLGTAFLPIFCQATEEGRGARFAGTFLSSILILSLILAGLMALAARPLVEMLLPGVGSGQRVLAARLFQLSVLSAWLHALFQIVALMHHQRGRFMLVGALPLLVNGTAMGAALLFAHRLGVEAIAIGMVIGHVVKLLVAAVPALRGCRLRLDWHDLTLRRAYRNAAPLLATGAVGKLDPVIERFVASGLAVGGISALAFAGKLIGSLSGMMTSGMTTVLFPRLAALQAEALEEDVGAALARSVVQSFLLILPVAAFLATFRLELVAALFERGRFSTQTTALVADTALAYTGVLVFGGVGSLLTRGFYVRGSTAAPAAISTAGTFLFLGLALALGRVMGVPGVALGYSLEFVFGFTLVVWLLGRMYAAFHPAQIVQKALEYAAWAGVSAFTAHCLTALTAPPTALAARGAWLCLQLGSGAAICFALYGTFLLFVRDPDAMSVAALFQISGHGRQAAVRGSLLRLGRWLAQAVAGWAPGHWRLTSGAKRP
jgi:putative peptidoglycan lipid II flippase